MRHAGGGARPARTWLYVRVSGREQASDGTSLDGQTERGRAYYRALGWPEPEVRVEVESAGEEKLERRVELHRLIADARPGDHVAVALLDRWSRDIVFGVGSIRKLVRAGVGFAAIHEQIDASTPNGDEMLGLRMWVAEAERRRIRDRTVGRADELRHAGLWAYGTVPWGYRRGPREQRLHLRLEADEHAEHVREAHERLASGDGLRSVVQFTASHGGPRHVASLHRLARGRIYLGEIWVGQGHHKREGAWLPGQHPALITVELWQRVQDALRERRAVALAPPTSVATVDMLLAGAVVCGLCGRRCSVGWVDKPSGRYRYFVCYARRRSEQDVPAGGPRERCAGPYARVEPLEEAAVEAVLERLGELREALAAPPIGEPAAKPESIDFDVARRRIESRLARAVALAVEEAITPAELAAQRARLEGELAKLRAREEAQARELRAANPRARGDLRRALGNLRRTWRGATIEERRRILRLLAAKVELLPDRTLRWTWRTVEDLLSE